jgi:transcriptional regulator with XRE-family HTH domain
LAELDALTKIQEVLKEQSKGQKDLTAHLGLAQSAFSSWKIGQSTSYQKYLPQIADFLGVSVDYLLGRSDDRHPPAPPGNEKAPHPEGQGEGVESDVIEAMRGLSDEDKRKVLEQAQLLRLKYRQ